ncbi:MAG: ammonium transporter [Intestinibacter sp.]|uniref:ammonium transporter n=1 Tax=Intestinibacter sp. TaxID=1965304 RepID=UPI002A82DD49|nr:ammonium transporter [Intestinibacter sp.]MDY4574883.1 ammonium transporter [Intestinibacter sp.]
MYSSVDTIWVLLGAALVFFMQAGFAMVETGFTRAKNAGNIIMKNLMDFACGSLIFWILGFGLMFAGNGKFIGGFDFFIQGDYGVEGGYPSWAFVIFQTVFCATAATIVSGAMAERTKFKSYLAYSIVISAVIYPISGHWIWGGGWLSQLGFIDFAGSTAVHMVGGVAALVGARILGPRIGKIDKDGNVKAIPGHNITLGALGVFILWFCWFGFNGCSTVSMTGDESIVLAGSVFVTTNIAAAAATVTTMIFTWVKYKKPDVSMTLNGSLAGLVAITAGCAAVNPVGACIIGIVAGIAVVVAIEFIDQKLKIDDPVGAIGVHGVCGALGTILTGVFAVDGGLVYGGGFTLFGVQCLGVVTVIAWVVVTTTVLFKVIDATLGLRVTEEEEVVGLDKLEHGLTSAYADFAKASTVKKLKTAQEKVSVDRAVPVQLVSNNRDSSVTASDIKLTKIEIITDQDKFKDLKDALSEIGIMGMTVSNVLGCGTQKGAPKYYRGIAVEMELHPKILVEIVVAKVPVQAVIDTAKEVLYTGNIGDGKIFVSTIDNAVKIRTGEEGVDALQYPEAQAN